MLYNLFIMYHLAKTHFKKVDPILYDAARSHAIPDLQRSKNVFRDLVQIIVNQQLSGKAAETIFGRLEIATGRVGVTPEGILKIRLPTLRKCGLSNSKAETIRGLARAVADGGIDLKTLHTYPDEKITEHLTSLKGIGPWTAEMILMFSLGRTDIFSKGDLGLRKGIMRLYGLKNLPSDRQMEKLTKAWKPYRTYAARVLWRVADEGKN